MLTIPTSHPGVAAPPGVTPHRRSNPRFPRGTAAFSLLEVMIGATVMVLAITTAITTMQRAFLALDYARKITLAGQIMQSKFEKMRLESWDKLTDTAHYPASKTLDIDAIFASSSAIIRDFTLTQTVNDVSGRTDMKQITLTMTWKSFEGRPVSRSYTTYYGKDGLYDYFYNSY